MVGSHIQYKDIWPEKNHIDGPVQHCSISIANALEILQSFTKPSLLSLYWESLELEKWSSYWNEGAPGLKLEYYKDNKVNIMAVDTLAP